MDTPTSKFDLMNGINSRGAFALNPLVVGAKGTLRSGCRLLSGASMDAGATLLEHTLVLSGDVVDPDTIVQGWPANVFLQRSQLAADVSSESAGGADDPAVTTAAAVAVAADSDTNGSHNLV